MQIKISKAFECGKVIENSMCALFPLSQQQYKRNRWAKNKLELCTSTLHISANLLHIEILVCTAAKAVNINK